MKGSGWLIVLAMVLMVSPSLASEFEPVVLVYDPQMPELAQGIADLLSEGSGDQFLVLADATATASMLALPNVRCVILTSVSSTDLLLLSKPVQMYFQSGGSVIGFHGSGWQNQLGDLARAVFPVFGNSTGLGTRKAGVPVNEYRRDEAIVGIGEDLPERFDLIGQFYAVSKNAEKELVEPIPETGVRTVLYRDDQTGSPLVVAYEGQAGGRSICFTGLFLRSTPNAANYFGKLLDQEEFKSLMTDCYAWCSEGSSRYNEFYEEHDAILEDARSEEERLRAKVENREASRRENRRLILIISWTLGLASVGVLVYLGFVRSR